LAAVVCLWNLHSVVAYAIETNRSRLPYCVGVISSAGRLRIVQSDGTPLPNDYKPKHTGSFSQLSQLLRASGVAPARADELVSKLNAALLCTPGTTPTNELDEFVDVFQSSVPMNALKDSIADYRAFEMTKKTARRLQAGEVGYRFFISVLGPEHRLADGRFVNILLARENYALVNFDFDGVVPRTQEPLRAAKSDEGPRNSAFTIFIAAPPAADAGRDNAWVTEVAQSVVSYTYFNFISNFIRANRTIATRRKPQLLHPAYVNNVRFNRGIIEIYLHWFRLLESLFLHDAMRPIAAHLEQTSPIEAYLGVLDSLQESIQRHGLGPTIRDLGLKESSGLLYVQARVASMNESIATANKRK